MRPIFISGMYKSGTSWLLRIFNNHPEIRSLKEVDIIKALLTNNRGVIALTDVQTRMENVFCKNAWSHLRGDFFTEIAFPSLISDGKDSNVGKVLDLPDQVASQLILLANLDRDLQKDSRYDHDTVFPVRYKNLSATFENLYKLYSNNTWEGNGSLTQCDPQALVAFYSAVKNGSSLSNIARSFITLLERSPWYSSAGYVCIKGADQLAVIDHMQSVFPDNKEIIVVRDGRDAVVSALKYKQLMKKRNASWLVNENIDYFNLLKTWRNRIRTLLSIEDYSVRFIRYEDLLNQFASAMSAVFKWFEIDYTTELIEKIHQKTSFQSVTGRSPGEEKQEVVRKGIHGDWMNHLSAEEVEKAWKIAKEELSILGYTQGKEISNNVRDAKYLLSA